MLLLVLMAGKWFDWWGGSTWGYRSIVDTAPFLALLMIPLMARVIAARATRLLFIALLVWSVGVQFTERSADRVRHYRPADGDAGIVRTPVTGTTAGAVVHGGAGRAHARAPGVEGVWHHDSTVLQRSRP